MNINQKYFGCLLLCGAFVVSIVMYGMTQRQSPDAFSMDHIKLLENRIQAEVEAEPLDFELGADKFFGSYAVQQAVISGTRDDFLCMVRQVDDYPFVVLTGFSGLKVRFPDLAPDAAVEIISKTQQPLSAFHKPIYDYLLSIPNTEENRRFLDSIEKATPHRFVNFVCLAKALDKNLLYEWFHERQGNIQQPWMATVLAELYSHKNIIPTTIMQGSLELCGDEAGHPRLTYLYGHDNIDEKYMERLRRCLEDETLDDRIDIAPLVRFHQKLIMDAIDIKDLQLSEKRRLTISNVLEST